MKLDMIFNIMIFIPVIIAGVYDFKYRIIPDLICIIIFCIGIIGILALDINNKFYIDFSQRAAGILPAALMFVIGFIKNDNGIGGGDIKIMFSLGFTLGLNNIIILLLFTTIIAMIWCSVKKQRKIPLAYFLMYGFFLHSLLVNIT